MTNNRIIAMLLMLIAAAPVAAHKQHHEPANAASTVAPGPDSVAPEATPQIPSAAPMPKDGAIRPVMQDDDDRSTMTTSARLVDWLGRLHVSIVHFPLAFFPAALFTAIVGRRRPGFARPVQFLIIAGGVTAPVAAAVGWLDGGMVLSDSDALLAVHRWLGTAIGLSAIGLAIWAWKRPDADRSLLMLAALGAITAALIVQGWYGGAMVHGIDHMNW